LHIGGHGLLYGGGPLARKPSHDEHHAGFYIDEEPRCIS
jgi:hypothetical protein